MESLERWVEQGIAPGKIIAKRVENGVTTMTRPVCPDPQIARYNGAGDSNDAARFSCSDPIAQSGRNQTDGQLNEMLWLPLFIVPASLRRLGCMRR
jgi:hypothetical protein